MSIGRCDACENYAVVKERGVCRRYPPTPVYDPTIASTDQYTQARWPLVEPDWGCAEFKKRKAGTVPPEMPPALPA